MPMKKKSSQFIAVVWKEGKHYVSQCLNIDVASFGKTRADALKHLEEAVNLYLDDSSEVIPKVESPSIEVHELQHA